ncbi:hypothetical protein [Ensifer sp. YR511]|uniref:hypothetical protein n=1 Tax=Ensifer sp. YR511 TaxID=1855294 RepID=UPI00115FCC41|nr:hypothetical protein [Ensifer sp. YR511]
MIAAAHEIPHRFIGTIVPGMRPEYTIDLVHHHHGQVRFTFRAGRPTMRKGLTTYRRSCHIKADALAVGASSFHERSFSIVLPQKEYAGAEFPDFYREGRRIRIEVAWRETGASRPVPSHGHFRYPIAYADTGASAFTGIGVHFSAPFISDTERHGLAEGAIRWNGDLIAACDGLLIRAMRQILPKVGPRAFDLLLDPDHPDLERTSHVLALALQERTVPKSGSSVRKREPAAPLVVPIISSDPRVIDKDLARIVPPDFEQIAAGVHPDIVGLLASRSLQGYGETHIVFDEEDALLRLQTKMDANPRFPWTDKSAHEKALADPSFAKIHLDVIWKPVAAKRKAAKAKVSAPLLPEAFALPSAKGRICLVKSMFLWSDIPTDLPGILVPLLVDQSLAGHPILGRSGWNRPTFTFEEFLSRFSKANPSTQSRLAMFKWVQQNVKKLRSATWPAVRDLAIWPDASGNPNELKELCHATHKESDKVLGAAIKRPSRDLLNLASALKRRKLRFAFRTHPSVEELRAWAHESFREFPRDRPLSSTERSQFRKLEEDLDILLSDGATAENISGIADEMPALNMDGGLGRWSELVRDAGSIRTLQLRPVHLLDRPRLALDKFFPPLPKPTVDMVRHALQVDPRKPDALIPRLRVMSEGGPTDLGVGGISCIPVHGEYRRPNDLSFKGNKGNFWGDWRLAIGATGLSDADQRLYKRAGVLSAEPSAETSLAFFRWLADDPSRVARHLPQVIRHFGSENGPRSWWEIQDNVPCLPVSGPGGYLLVSYKEAVNKSSAYYVDDFPELAEALQTGEYPIHLVVSQSQGVRISISEHLLEAGVKSLRATAGQPKSVRGSDIQPVPAWVMTILGEYQSRRIAEDLQKALVALGVSSALINTRWYSQIGSIKQVVGARDVIATYKIGRMKVSGRVRHAFDPETGVLWLAELNESEMEDAFFDALAERIFVPNAPGYCAPALDRALRAKIRQAEHLQAAQGTTQDEEDLDRENDEVGEAPPAHHDWKPDPSKNIPKPNAIPGNPAKSQARKGSKSGRARQRASVPNELEQIRELKENHYAWHCQIALATNQPKSLAPDGSYVQHQENRKRLIDAHHPDLVEAGGARHAGNIVVLSHLAHHQYGRHLSREKITAALKAGGKPKQVQFGSAENAITVDGVIINVGLPATQSSVSLFFTDWHRRYWIENV